MSCVIAIKLWDNKRLLLIFNCIAFRNHNSRFIFIYIHVSIMIIYSFNYIYINSYKYLEIEYRNNYRCFFSNTAPNILQKYVLYLWHSGNNWLVDQYRHFMYANTIYGNNVFLVLQLHTSLESFCPRAFSYRIGLNWVPCIVISVFVASKLVHRLETGFEIIIGMYVWQDGLWFCVSVINALYINIHKF